MKRILQSEEPKWQYLGPKQKTSLGKLERRAKRINQPVSNQDTGPTIHSSLQMTSERISPGNPLSTFRNCTESKIWQLNAMLCTLWALQTHLLTGWPTENWWNTYYHPLAKNSPRFLIFRGNHVMITQQPDTEPQLTSSSAVNSKKAQAENPTGQCAEAFGLSPLSPSPTLWGGLGTLMLSSPCFWPGGCQGNQPGWEVGHFIFQSPVHTTYKDTTKSPYVLSFKCVIRHCIWV